MLPLDEIVTNIKTLAAEQGLEAVEAYVKEQLGDDFPENIPAEIKQALIDAMDAEAFATAGENTVKEATPVDQTETA